MASVLTVTPEDVEADLEEGLLSAASDGLDDEDFGRRTVDVDQVRDRFPLQNAPVVVECGSEGGWFKFESEKGKNIWTFQQK